MTAVDSSRLTRFATSRTAMLLLLALSAAAVFLNSLANGFALDDVAIIQENTRVHNLRDLRAIWLTPYWPYFGVELGLWRPLAIFGYALQWSAGGGEPWLFHAVNVGLHAVTTILVFLLLERLTATVPAFAGALVFAVHPLHTEAVANIVGQAELIAAAAMVAACVIYARRPVGIPLDWRRRWAMLALFLVAILAKEHAVVLPALLLLIDITQRRIAWSSRGLLDYARDVATPLTLLFVALAAYLAVRYSVLDGNLTGIEAGPQLHFLREELRVLNALRAFPEFFRLLFFPQDLVADYSPAIVLPVESFTVMTVIGALLLAVTVVFALMTPWAPHVGFPAAWFLITVLTVSNLFFPIGVLIAERTLYAPSIAVSALVAWGWLNVAPQLQRRGKAFATVALVIIVTLLGLRTWVRNPDWKDTRTLLYSVLRDHPESYKAQWTHANWQWQLGRPDVARYHYELGYRIYPRDSQLLTEYANFLISRGESDRALELLEDAHDMHPYVPRTTILLGMAYLAHRRYTDAMRMADHAVQIGIGPNVTLPIRAAALDGLGQNDRALATWRYIVTNVVLEPPVQWAFVARRLARAGLDDQATAAIRRGLDAATADTAAAAILQRMDAAIRAGCFSAANGDAGSPDGLRQGREPSDGCDPLGTGTPYVPGLQNATPLQNARPTG